MISVFEIYKIGIGPSSSHTFGPMKAAKIFIDELIESHQINSTEKIVVDIYGSLSLTGKGHLTDTAIILGLAGYEPATVNIKIIPDFIDKIKKSGRLVIFEGKYEVDFNYDTCMNFHSSFLPLHENGMVFSAYNQDNALVFTQTFYSIGGGTVIDEKDFNKKQQDPIDLPYPFTSANKLLYLCKENQLSIAQLMLENELCFHTLAEIETYFESIKDVMKEAIDNGITATGVLPGPYQVPRRAALLYEIIMNREKFGNDPMVIMDWVNLFALAVNEENAAGGRVVTAPTNGACGIVPAVLAYYDRFVEPLMQDSYLNFFLTSSAIAILYKMNASISGAEVGCQGEVGVACSMAAAGLAAVLGGTPDQICSAAEIGMEHNLGLTCDPIGGQVQVPCIERNAIGAVKAINAARMALHRIGSEPQITLDEVIQTMYQTGKDMHVKYRETSLGGLAAVLNECS